MLTIFWRRLQFKGLGMIQYKSEIADNRLTAIAEESARSENATEQEALGLAIAHHFAWDGIALFEVFASALEDANFHAECAVVRGWIGGDA